jgi:hypothetical protein
MPGELRVSMRQLGLTVEEANSHLPLCSRIWLTDSNSCILVSTVFCHPANSERQLESSEFASVVPTTELPQFHELVGPNGSLVKHFIAHAHSIFKRDYVVNAATLFARLGANCRTGLATLA